VIMNPIPKPNATSLRRALSITMFLEYPVDEDSSSEVIKTMIAVTASQRPMSETDRGKFIVSSLYSSEPHFNSLSVW